MVTYRQQHVLTCVSLHVSPGPVFPSDDIRVTLHSTGHLSVSLVWLLLIIGSSEVAL